MKRVYSLALCLFVVAALASSAWGDGSATIAAARDYSGHNIADRLNADVVRYSDGSALSKAAGDTFYLFGGPGTLTGKFQTSTLQPDRQGWLGMDLTETVPHWNVSDFNAANLGAQPGYWIGAYTVPAVNHAIWNGVPAGTPGIMAAPGYGNNWNDPYERRWTVNSTAVATNLTWNFVFNHDSEPGYDFLIVQWDSSGSWLDLAAFDADNRDTSGTFTTPALYSTTLQIPVGQYGGPLFNQAHIRLLFQSDGAWSDEDGLWPTDGGCQVDNIQVTGDNGVGLSQATFEGGANGGWQPAIEQFVGDFTKVFARVEDLDPCRDNDTPQMTFIDDGTPPNNDPLMRSTGGSISSSWSYGVPGGWVPNYTGGLTLGANALTNEIWSQEIVWDLPTTLDDQVDGGAILGFDVWQHLPLQNGFFYVWAVRSFPDPATGTWSGWKDNNFVYYGGGITQYINFTIQVRTLLVAAPTKVQIALGCVDQADLRGYPGNDATPSPTLDNVRLWKYNGVGPGITTRDIDIFNDGFPTSGAVTCTPVDDTDLAIRMDMARDIRPTFLVNMPGDSVIADFLPRKPGASVVVNSIKLEFVLDANSCFAAERAPGIAALQAGAGTGASDIQLIAPNKYRGYVTGKQSRTSGGAPIANRYFFDLPDGPIPLATYHVAEPALFFPGDHMRYFFAGSTINPVESNTLPADTTGFTDGVRYNRRFRVSGLPTLTCGLDTDACTQPSILLWNDATDRGNEEELMQAFNQNGLKEFAQFDTYGTQGPSSNVGNGLGSAGRHGANPSQLAGYSCLIYDNAALSWSLSNGSNTTGQDKGDDVGLLTAWFAQPAGRFAAYFGDDVVAGLRGSGITFSASVMGVSYVRSDARSAIGNQTAPRVAATAAGTVLGFGQSYVAYGGCLGINVFDEIGPGVAGAVKSHEFLTTAGAGGVYPPSASVYYARQDTIAAQVYSRANVTFPYGFAFVYDVSSGAGNSGGRTARANLLRELLINAGHSGVLDQFVVATDPIAGRRLTVAQNRPNPFNPVTEIAFSTPARGAVAVKVYNLRGELVTTLLNGVVEAGPQAVTWNGTDARGTSVASGIYVYRVEGFGQVETRKMALIK